jgi:hypothetical protein
MVESPYGGIMTDDIEDLEVIEFTDTFSIDWLSEKLRHAGVYGGIKSHLIPTKAGYLIPERARRGLEGYYEFMYHRDLGGVVIDSHETYTLQYINNIQVLTVHAQALVAPTLDAPPVLISLP